MGGETRARRRERASEFGRRHPSLVAAIVFVVLAGLILICVSQLVYGSMLGRDWVVAALAGMAAAVGLGVTALVSNRRHGPWADHLAAAVLATGVASVLAFRCPFPRGSSAFKVPPRSSYGTGQAVINVVHAALLGYQLVFAAAILALLAYQVVRPGSPLPRLFARPGRAPRPAVLQARLRFHATGSANWRAGHLTAKNHTVTWKSLKGDVEVDLTSALQALPAQSADADAREPRTTMLATASGLAEVDVSPRALAELVRKASLSATR